MTATTTRLGLLKGIGSDNARDYLKTSLAASLDVLDGAIGPADLLTNGGFEVNQRGGTVTANNAYAHDRWQHLLGGTSTGTITDETTIVDTGSGHALKWVYTQGTANSSIDQKIEDYLSLRGRTVSFRIRVRQGVASTVRAYISDSGTKTYSATQATTGSYLTFTITLAIGAAATSVRVGVELSASDTVYLDNASLVEGATAVPYVPLHPAENLARCERYLERIGGDAATFEPIGIGYCLSTTVARLAPVWRVEKAVTPTITFSTAGHFRVLTAGATTVTGTGSANVSKKSGLLDFTVASGLTAGDGCAVTSQNASANLTIEANP